MKRSKNLFNPDSKEPYPLSRSKIEFFCQCPRCFYLDRRLGISQPPSPPFRLNSAVDTLLKKEFDIHRVKKTAHPFMEAYGIDAVPFQHPKIEEWRDALRRGIRHLHPPTNLFITGGIDDLWVSPGGELFIVDYKATAKDGEVGIDADWQVSYKRQVEIYQWLFRQNGFRVSDTAYFVYCNGDTDKEAFDGKLEFRVRLIPYQGNDEWIEKTLLDIRSCLTADTLPPQSRSCAFCSYREAARTVERE